jgi:hypothetical protein
MINKEGFKNAWKKHPIALTLGFVGLVGSLYMIYKNNK